jgi:hypothetical protein
MSGRNGVTIEQSFARNSLFIFLIQGQSVFLEATAEGVSSPVTRTPVRPVLT